MKIIEMPVTLPILSIVSNFIRPADEYEIRSATGLSKDDALYQSVTLTDDASCAVIDVDNSWQMVGIFGCQNTELGGVPWFIGCEAFDEHAQMCTKFTKRRVDEYKKRWSVLYNWVHDENRAAHGWLEMLGFRLFDPAPYGAWGEDFRQFLWREDGQHV